jgi:hypothetical protein
MWAARRNPRAPYLPDAPDLVRFGVSRCEVYGEKEIGLTWAMAGAADRKAVDTWLVSTKDPIAFEAGTAEHRFGEVVRRYLKKKSPLSLVASLLSAFADYGNRHPSAPRRNPLTRAEAADLLHEMKKHRALEKYFRTHKTDHSEADSAQHFGAAQAFRRAVSLYGPVKRYPRAILNPPAGSRRDSTRTSTGGASTRTSTAKSPTRTATVTITQNPRRTPAPRVVTTLPATNIIIRYRRSGKHPGLYEHKFAAGVKVQGMSDGSVRISGSKPAFMRQ